MSLATALISTALAAILAFAAIRKLSHRPEVVESYVRVGVPEEKLDYLALILFAGAAGLLAGILWAPLGVAAAIGLVAYFALAIGAHFRHDDLEHVATPIVIALLAAGVLALRLIDL